MIPTVTNRALLYTHDPPLVDSSQMPRSGCNYCYFDPFQDNRDEASVTPIPLDSGGWPIDVGVVCPKARYAILKVEPDRMEPRRATNGLALALEVDSDVRALQAIADAIAGCGARITWISILDAQKPVETILIEVAGAKDRPSLIQSLEGLPCIRSVTEKHTLHHIFGKRIVIIGGGSQVGQVVLGAVSEADRHNLRGERISIDTIPLVGEEQIAEAVRATARLPRVNALVLAGAMMGGLIQAAVREVQAKGLLVISLNMVGSVPDVADLVVTDPVQAGVMAVMAVAHTAEFDIQRLKGRRF